MVPLLNRGGMMKGFVQVADRQQTTLLPECPDDWVDESNPVRAVDVFVDALADEDGQKMRIYLTKACRTCPLKDQCTTSSERRIKRWEHEHVVEAAQTRLDQNPQAMRVRRETVEHPFATLKMRMGATHFLMKRLPNVATEMALNVLAYNLTRVMNIVGIKPLLVAIRA